MPADGETRGGTGKPEDRRRLQHAEEAELLHDDLQEVLSDAERVRLLPRAGLLPDLDVLQGRPLRRGRRRLRRGQHEAQVQNEEEEKAGRRSQRRRRQS